jgi:thiol:disulfide interchange protein
MARISLWSSRNQRSLPLWLVVLAALLIAGRVISLQYPVAEPQASLAEPPPAAEASLVKWVSVSEAPALAKAERKRIFYEFSAAWCGPCKLMNQEVFNDPKLAALLNERFIAVRVVDRRREDGSNTPDVEELQDRFHVQAFPTIVVSDADGVSQANMVGYPGRDAVAQLLMRPPGS